MEENQIFEEQESSPALETINESAQTTSGNELLDATQNAIIGAAENVTEALTLTEKPITPKEEQIPLYMDVEFWVGMSFVVVVIMIAKPIWRAIKDGLKNRINTIINQLDEAKNLRDDAQKLLAEYEKRCNDLNQRVAQISEQTEKNIALYRETEFKNLQRELNKKEKEVQARIERATETAKNEINASISSKAVNYAREAIEKHLSQADKLRLIDEAIAELDKLEIK